MTIASSFSRAAWGTLDKYTVIRRHLFTSSSAPAHKLLGYPAASGIAHLGGTAIVGGLAAYHSEPCVRPWLIGATAIFSAILGASIYSSEKIVDKANVFIAFVTSHFIRFPHRCSLSIGD
jgi:hypothetical protein